MELRRPRRGARGHGEIQSILRESRDEEDRIRVEGADGGREAPREAENSGA